MYSLFIPLFLCINSSHSTLSQPRGIFFKDRKVRRRAFHFSAFKKNSPDFQTARAFEIVLIQLTRKDTVFYTNGSKIDSDFYVEAVVYSSQLGLQLMHKLPGNTSIFPAEA